MPIKIINEEITKIKLLTIKIISLLKKLILVSRVKILDLMAKIVKGKTVTNNKIDRIMRPLLGSVAKE